MALIFIKIFIIICLSMSLISDFSVHATCTNTNNCGSDSGAFAIGGFCFGVYLTKDLSNEEN